MTPRDIIAKAWAITQKERVLKRWGFFSSFFETLLNLKLVAYQAYFAYSFFITKESVGFFDDFIWLYDNVSIGIFITIMTLFGILLVIEWFVPHLALGAIIGLAAKSYKGEEPKGGLVLALYNFFPLFAIHEFLILSGWAMTITLCSLILRYIPGEAKLFMVGIVLLFWVFSNILQFFFSFAQPAVVVEKRGIFDAMGQSFKLIVSYLGQIMFLMLLLFVISIRVLINTVIVLIIPVAAVGLSILLTYVLSHALSYLIAGLVALGMVIVASYFFGYLHVFQHTVWTITYLELKKHKALDVIEE